MSWLSRRKSAKSSKAVYWYDTFTEAVDTVITSHTPNIGGAYPTGRSINNTTLGANNPTMTVDGANDYLRGNGTYGPIFNVGVTRCAIQFKVASIAAGLLNWRYAFRVSYANSNRGWKVSYTAAGPNQLTILDAANTNRGTYNVTLSVGDIIKIEDDGTNATTWLKVYVNGSLVLTTSVASNDTTYTEHSWWSTQTTAAIDDLLITEI